MTLSSSWPTIFLSLLSSANHRRKHAAFKKRKADLSARLFEDSDIHIRSLAFLSISQDR
jgi:hypothetical protein